MNAYQGGIAKFSSADTVILGISTDDLETQTKFAESLNLEFALLADEGGKVAESYGIRNERGMASRTTFVIDKMGKVSEVITGGEAISIDSALSACTKL